MNSAEQIKSGKVGANIDDIYLLLLFWLKQALSFLHGVCISRPSVLTQINRHTNLIFQ
jgi:hypothetical protein